jgi:hypothetical protein
MTSYNYSYNVLINRLEAFAAGHFLIKRFTHGQIDLADQLQDDQYPFMHVTPDTITPIQGGMQFGFLVMFADIPRDKEYKAEYQREVISDCIRLGQDLIAEVRNGLELFGFDVQLVNIPTFEPFIEEYKNTITGVGFTLTLEVPWDWSACDIPAVWTVGGSSSGGSGTGYGLTLRTNGVDNAVQNILDLVEGTNVTITDNGDGSVTIDAAGGGGSGEFVSTEYSVNHTTATGNPYQIGDRVWYNGSVYRCISNNDAINPTNPSYWTLVAVGYRLRQSPVDWNATSGDYQILNKPTIPAAQVNSDWDAVSGVAEILNKPTIPAAQVNSDWDAVSGVEEILNKPTLATVATTGDYADLINQPFIPTNLDDLTDVNTPAPTNGQVLTYNTTSGDWEAVTPTGSPLTTKGDIYTYSTNNARLAVGTNGQVLLADSSTATGLKWGANTLPPASGYYLAISDSTTQANPTADIPRAVKFNTTDLANGFSLQTQTAVFTGTINNGGAGAGTILTVTGVSSGTLKVGMVLTGGSITAGTFISAFTSGTGGVGTYVVSVSQLRTSATYTGTMTSQIVVANTGVYNIQFSSQMDKTDSGVDYVNFWLRRNGVDVTASAGVISLQGNSPAYMMAAWNYLIELIAGDIVELYWGSTDTGMSILSEVAQTSPFAHPAVPSTILTITQQAGILAGTGITAINSLTDAVQTLGTGTSGTDFGIVSSGTSHTFNLPTASATNRGALSSANWSTFNGKQDALVSGTNIKTVNSTSLLGSGNVSVGTVTSVGGTGTTAGLSLSGTVTGSGNITLGGTLSTPVSTINDSTTVGQNLVKLPNPSATRYVRINSDNTVSALTLAELKADIGIGGYAVLTSDFITSGTAYQNITGLSFAVTANKIYKWRATISILATGTVNGMLSTNGPAGTTVYRFTIGTGATTNTINNGVANNTGTSVAISTTTRIASADGIYIPTANGTVSMSVIASANALITIRTGSIVEFEEVA